VIIVYNELLRLRAVANALVNGNYTGAKDESFHAGCGKQNKSLKKTSCKCFQEIFMYFSVGLV